ncbi:hypothetical protein BGX38DRAFT_1243040 [Terfezia claveryi]|nr:hypothetical protein BGX38DRAFT_1243040 [Terfezia claveryi]
MPVEKGEGGGGPRMVKCHSKRELSLRGCAWMSGVGWLLSSEASRTRQGGGSKLVGASGNYEVN